LAIGFGTGNTNVIAATSVVQHITAATATTIAAATSVIVLDGTFADAAAMITAIGGGTTTLTLQAANPTNDQDYVVVWSDAAGAGHIGLVNDSDAGGAAVFVAAELTYSEVATLVGVSSMTTAASANFVFVA